MVAANKSRHVGAGDQLSTHLVQLFPLSQRGSAVGWAKQSAAQQIAMDEENVLGYALLSPTYLLFCPLAVKHRLMI